jgi:hypothetical protein
LASIKDACENGFKKEIRKSGFISKQHREFYFPKFFLPNEINLWKKILTLAAFVLMIIVFKILLKISRSSKGTE